MSRRKNASADTADTADDVDDTSAELDANDEARTTTSQSASIENNDYLNQMIDQTLLQTYQHLDLQHLQTNNQANTRWPIIIKRTISSPITEYIRSTDANTWNC